MKKRLFLATSLLVLNANPASAWSCKGTTQENFTRASAVFTGKVIDIEPSLDNEQQINRFEVSRVWKGKLVKQHFVTTSGSHVCGYAFEKGEEYLVYASYEESALRTSSCSGTKLLSNSEPYLRFLGHWGTLFQKDSNKAQLQQNKQLWAKQKVKRQGWLESMRSHPPSPARIASSALQGVLAMKFCSVRSTNGYGLMLNIPHRIAQLPNIRGKL
jgi:hypothetical protein